MVILNPISRLKCIVSSCKKVKGLRFSEYVKCLIASYALFDISLVNLSQNGCIKICDISGVIQ